MHGLHRYETDAATAARALDFTGAPGFLLCMAEGQETIVLVTAALTGEQAARIAAALPGARIVGPADLEADPGLIERVAVCYPSLPEELWRRAHSLRWLQCTTAGVDRLLGRPEVREHPALITNVHIHGACAAEHLWGMALALTRNINRAIRQQERGTWDRGPLMEGMANLEGGTLCVAGLGTIGAACARIGRAFGMRVVGVSRRAGPRPFADEVVGPEDRAEAFARSRLIMLVLPDTAETRGFVGRREIDAMSGAYLLNGGRGTAVDTEALVLGLAEGRVRGAGLDVTDPEPLPAGHPLWRMPNVVITPHYAGDHPGYYAEAFDVFCVNLERWARGLPLLHVVDRAAGY
jgi:D-2-hydroxyacid dehydrogenase (NADP+)